MRKLKVKVCGMRDPANIAEVAALRPDYMGFIFAKTSKRWIGKDFDPVHLNLLSAETKACGVFVGEYLPTLIDRVDYYHFDVVQLHGDEPAEYCKKLRGKLDAVEIIKSFAVDAQFDFGALSAYEGCVNYFLFDNKGVERGGTGTAFDWSLLQKYTLQTPYFLAGGVAADSASAINKLAESSPQLYGIDLNSRFESEPALKTAATLANFLKEL